MLDNKINSIGDYDEIMSDRNIFNQVVYTPLSDALRILEERQKDTELVSKIEKLFKGKIPDILKQKKCGVIARQLATPNNENRMFISIAIENGLSPVFFEYTDDKFTSNNKYKHSLGQLHIHNKFDKNGEECVEKITIVDFNKYTGKKIRDVLTIWNQPLIDFHKELFKLQNLNNLDFHDESIWYKENDIKEVNMAYFNFFLLFVCFGILFENFLVSKDSEGDFTKKVVLPELEKVIKITGLKPLIVPIEAIDLEIDDFWYHHLPIVKDKIKK